MSDVRCYVTQLVEEESVFIQWQFCATLHQVK